MEKEIKEQISPLVSVCCTTYNHAPFIRQCLDGFVMQKTSFSFEVLIHDDASTDGTQDIIQEYAIRYPDIIKPIYQAENQYSKGVKICLTYIYPRVKGKYIALCEGDDYWTDPYKLQKQVDFLESHLDYVMCSHDVDIYFQKKNLYIRAIKGIPGQGIIYDLDYLIQDKTYCTFTQSVMYRRDALDLKQFRLYKVTQDNVLFFHLLKSGKGYCMPDVMAVYRKHSGGVWSGSDLEKQVLMTLNQRIAIYEVEKSEESARYLLLGFDKTGRKGMQTQKRRYWYAFRLLCHHYGYMRMTLSIFHKFIFGKIKILL